MREDHKGCRHMSPPRHGRTWPEQMAGLVGGKDTKAELPENQKKEDYAQDYCFLLRLPYTRLTLPSLQHSELLLRAPGFATFRNLRLQFGLQFGDKKVKE